MELQADLLRRKLAVQSNQNNALQQMVTELKNRPAAVIPPLIPRTEAPRTGGASRTALSRSESQSRPAATPVSGHAASLQSKREPPKMARLPVSQIAIAKPNHTPMLAPPNVMSAAPATSLPKMESYPRCPRRKKQHHPRFLATPGPWRAGLSGPDGYKGTPGWSLRAATYRQARSRVNFQRDRFTSVFIHGPHE
ncbi:MAG: hypothetical protein DMG57_05040 [Acidobacteria bacterium]|nr:MAG: hypothetical protein DMG57_05040 [Acidobacteriota bacterium]